MTLSPPALVGLLCLLQLVFWAVVPSLAITAPPLDVIEMLAWGQEWQWGYYKHPPLPAWLAELSVIVTGSVMLGPLLASQLCVCLTFVFVFLTGRRLLGAERGALGTVLLVGVFYFTFPTPELNHNIVQMPLWAGILYLFCRFWQVPQEQGVFLWIGVLFGIGVYAKYSVIVLALTLCLWMILDPRLRPAFRRWPVWAGIAVSAIVSAPHFVWLVESAYLPLQYAADRSTEKASIFSSVEFLLGQIVNHLPLLALLLFAGGKALLARPVPRLQVRGPSPVAFLTIATLGPSLLLAVLAQITGFGLRNMWGAPMYATSGLLAVALLHERVNARRALGAALAVQVVTGLIYAALVPIGTLTGKKPSRNAWPMAQIAARAADAWDEAVPTPLRIVGGSGFLANLVSAGLPARPSVRYGADGRQSPWITDAALHQHGALLLSDGQPIPMEGGRSGSFTVPFGKAQKTIHYTILPPGAVPVP